MRYVALDAPGTWCLKKSFSEMISPIENIASFIEIGPGAGKLSETLCSQGLSGIGVEFSKAAIEKLSINMKEYLKSGQYSIVEADFIKTTLNIQADLVFSINVMEHIENDLSFLIKLKQLVKINGKIVVGVPGRKDKWNIEDEVFGHYRRYERDDLINLFKKAGIVSPSVWSVSVPLSNLLFGLSKHAVRKSSSFKKKKLSRSKQTKLSGIEDTEYKALFPLYFKLLLNKYSMFPFFQLQRLFYNTDIGLTLLGCGINDYKN